MTSHQTPLSRFLANANDTLGRHAPGRTVELEVRLGQISLASYQASLAILRAIDTSPPTEEKSLSIISAISGARGESKTLVMRKFHPSGNTITMFKTHCGDVFQNFQVGATGCRCKVACSIEQEVKDAPTPANSSLVRFRIRSSRAITIGQHLWSADITLIMESTLSQVIANKKMKDDFYDSQIGAQHYEVELELMQRAPGIKITEDDIHDAIARACSIAYPQGIDVGVSKNPRELLMRTVARTIGAHGRKLRGPRQDAALTLKMILNAAVSMTKNFYIREVFPMDGFYATDKADGDRGLAIIDSEGKVAVITDTTMFGTCNVDGLATIYDGEVIIVAEKVAFYAFDCLWSEGESMLEAPFESRLAEIQPYDVDPITVRAKKFRVISADKIRETVEAINSEERPYPIDGIIFTQPGVGYYETKNYKWKPPASTTIDFLCIRCPERLYGSRPYVLPRESISLSASAKGRSDFRIYLLFCSCDERQRAELCIQRLPFHDEMLPPELRGSAMHFVCRFEPFAYILILTTRDLEPFGGDIHNKVVEMRWRMHTQSESADGEGESPRRDASHDVEQHMTQGEPWRHWDLLRVRTDRANGNNISVATNIFANYVSPFPLEALWQPVSGYFAKETEDVFIASNKFRRFIITIIFHNAFRSIKNPRVIDFGGGRAQDFVRYAIAGASHVVNLDSDAMAITESVVRIESQMGRGGASALTNMQAARWLKALGETLIGRGRGECAAPVYIARVLDLTTQTVGSFRETLYSIGFDANRFDVVVSSFAFHYFCTSRATMERIFALIDASLCETGIVIITTMDGKRVYELLKEHGGVWRVSEPDSDIPKYEIHALYDAANPEMAMRDFGQMVRVSIPFANEMYEEPLCNFDAVREVAASAGFNATELTDYGDSNLFDLLRRADRKLADALTPIDREYTGLFKTIIFKRASGTATAPEGDKKTTKAAPKPKPKRGEL